MSITNRHAIIPFIAGKTAPLNEQRLSKVGYKSSKSNPAKFPSVAASVPVIPAEDILARMSDLVPYVRNLLETAQDGIFRSLYESSGGLRTELGDSEIGIDSIIGYLESESNGGRLTIESINSWFDGNVRDNLTVVIADKIGAAEIDDPRIAGHINSYRGLLASLSGGKTLLQPTQISGLRKAIEIASTDDEMSARLIARLDSMEKKPKIEELLEL
jgi:hypothetical protein